MGIMKFNQKIDRLVRILSDKIILNVKTKFVLCGIYSGGVILGEKI